MYKRVIAQDAGCDFMYVKKKMNIQRKILEIHTQNVKSAITSGRIMDYFLLLYFQKT